MKKNGFTLIELLAVIVILAIIALIATPIILGIINDAREKANERSVELYAAAVKNGIAAYQLVEGKEVAAGTYTKETLPFEVEYDGKVDCTSIIISDDSKVSLEGCTVNGGEKEYSYGVEEDETPEEETPDTGSTQVYKPQYYPLTNGFFGFVGDPAPSNPLTVAPEGKSFYLGYDVTDGKISAGYVCFVRNETEYCLKGDDKEAFTTNTDIIKDAYSDVVDTDACSLEETNYLYYHAIYSCEVDGLRVFADSGGDAGYNRCDVSIGGTMSCYVD